MILRGGVGCTTMSAYVSLVLKSLCMFGRQESGVPGKCADVPRKCTDVPAALPLHKELFSYSKREQCVLSGAFPCMALECCVSVSFACQ